jgi:hypothetical protein
MALTVGLLHPKGGTLPRLVLGSVDECPGAAHLLAFVFLAALVCASRLRVRPLSSVATLFAYGVATELAQIYVPGRHARLVDALANTLGIAAGVILWRWLLEPRLCRPKSLAERGLSLPEAVADGRADGERLG